MTEDKQLTENTSSPETQSGEERLSAMSREELVKYILTLEGMVSHDLRTGWLSTREITRQGIEQISAARRKIQEGKDAQLSFVYIDLDRFGQVNKKIDQLFGDIVLKQSGMTIDKSLRAGTLIGRIGGDEGLIIAPNATNEEIETMMERIEENLETDLSYIFHKKDKSLMPGLSWGVCTMSEIISDSDKQISDVDLYLKMKKDSDKRMREQKNKKNER